MEIHYFPKSSCTTTKSSWRKKALEKAIEAVVDLLCIGKASKTYNIPYSLTIYNCSKNGWINHDLFVIWLKHFATSTDEPILIVLPRKQYSHSIYSAPDISQNATGTRCNLWSSKSCFSEGMWFVYEKPCITKNYSVWCGVSTMTRLRFRKSFWFQGIRLNTNKHFQFWRRRLFRFRLSIK